MGNSVKLIKNYEKGNRRLLKGLVINVTPWFKEELEAEGYIAGKETVKKIHTRNKLK